MAPNYVRWFEEIGTGDVASVGGKNASLGEMVRKLGSRGIKVPTGFATTADAYWHFIKTNCLEPLIASNFAEFKAGKATVTEIGSAIRSAIISGEWPEDLGRTIRQAYQDLSAAPRHGRGGRCGSLERDGRRPARGELRRSAGELPERSGRGRPA